MHFSHISLTSTFLADSGGHHVATDDETDLIEAIGEFDLQEPIKSTSIEFLVFIFYRRIRPVMTIRTVHLRKTRSLSQTDSISLKKVEILTKLP